MRDLDFYESLWRSRSKLGNLEGKMETNKGHIPNNQASFFLMMLRYAFYNNIDHKFQRVWESVMPIEDWKPPWQPSLLKALQAGDCCALKAINRGGRQLASCSHLAGVLPHPPPILSETTLLGLDGRKPGQSCLKSGRWGGTKFLSLRQPPRETQQFFWA